MGQLEGWGRGKGNGSSALYFQRSAGSVSRAVAQWVVTGSGTVRIRAGNCRMGFLERTVEV